MKKLTIFLLFGFILSATTAFAGMAAGNITVTARISPKCVITNTSRLLQTPKLDRDSLLAPLIMVGEISFWCTRGTPLSFLNTMGDGDLNMYLISDNNDDRANPVIYKGALLDGKSWFDEGMGPNSPFVYRFTATIPRKHFIEGAGKDGDPNNIQVKVNY